MIDNIIRILTFMARIVDHRWVYIDEKMMNMTITMMTILDNYDDYNIDDDDNFDNHDDDS